MRLLGKLFILCVMAPFAGLSQAQWNQMGNAIYLDAPYSVGVQTISHTTALGIDGSLNASAYFINGAPLQLWSNTGDNLTYTGSVGIGSTSNETLSVNGTTLAEKVIIDLNVAAPDYVFESDYYLTPLEELEMFIRAHKHLPYLPSAKEMEQEGVNVGNNQMALLRTMEELMLHQIEMDESLTKLSENQEKMEETVKEISDEKK